MTQRYDLIAPAYDVLSLEWPIYGVGRQLGIPLLRLGPGDTVLDVGCGTGLNFPLLRRAVGASGVIIGVDASPSMLARARRRSPARTDPATGSTESAPTTSTQADRDAPVRVWCRDATDLSGLSHDEPQLTTGADAVLFTYSLSLMSPWRQAWDQALSLARPGARVLIVDMARPEGVARVLSPLARASCWLGGADIDAHPWSALVRDCTEVSHRIARGGHLQVWAGTVPGARAVS